MFETCLDFSDVALGLILAGVILYMFYVWVKSGSEQWDKWEAMPMLTDSQRSDQSRRLRFLFTPNKWLADTYPVAMFWGRYYGAYYGVL